MSQHRRSLLLTVGFGLLFAALPADAYRMIQVTTTGRVTFGNAVTCNNSGGFAHWRQSDYENIVWRLNTSGQGSGKANAIQSAMQSWNGVWGADHHLTYGGTTSAGWSTDGLNTIVFAFGNGCTGNCLGLTALVMQSGQRIVEADITFNASVQWRTNGTNVDTQAVATHELGHSLGIHHTEVNSTPRPTMWWNYNDTGVGGRSLESDDRAALQCSQNRYGIRPMRVTVSGPTARNPNQSGTWTCSVFGGLGPYTYSWFKTTTSGYQDLGSGTSKSTSDTQSFNMVCDVRDSRGVLATDALFVDVDGEPGFPLPE